MENTNITNLMDLTDIAENVQAGMVALRVLAHADASEYGIDADALGDAFEYVYGKVEAEMNDVVTGIKANWAKGKKPAIAK